MPLPTYDPADYPAQLAAKAAHFEQNFAGFGVTNVAVHASEPLHYRMRAEFGIWHDGDQLDYTMSDPENPKQKILFDTFPPAAESICAIMPRLWERLIPNDALRSRLFQVDLRHPERRVADYPDLPPQAGRGLGSGRPRTGR